MVQLIGTPSSTMVTEQETEVADALAFCVTRKVGAVEGVWSTSPLKLPDIP
jgi:hypothetical protein